MKFLSTLFLCVFVSHLGFSLDERDEYFMRFDSDVATGPKVLEYQFGRNENWVLNHLNSQNLDIKNKIEDEKMHLAKWLVDGAPKGLAVTKGKTDFVFFKKRLIQVRINFQANYENFLIVRGQLFSSFGTRFKIEKELVAMDDLLKARLSSLGKNAFNKLSDEAVTKALERGNTYWFYQIKDNTDALSVSLSYRSIKLSNGQMRPELELFYAWNEGVNSWETFKETQKISILPE